MRMHDVILNHLKTYKTITTYEAIQKYGCTRLSHYIWELRNDGYIIVAETVPSKNRYGHRNNYAKYVLRGRSDGNKENVFNENS